MTPGQAGYILLVVLVTRSTLSPEHFRVSNHLPMIVLVYACFAAREPDSSLTVALAEEGDNVLICNS